MAQNDMYVVMYKIIAYLYDRMKRGERPAASQWDASAMGIPEPYWTRIVSELARHGLVAGVIVRDTAAGTVVTLSEPYVTMEGVAFAQENSMMAKACSFLREAKAAVPFI